MYGDPSAFDFNEVQDLHGDKVSRLGAYGDFKDLDGEFTVTPEDVTKIAGAAGQAFSTYQQVESGKDILSNLPRPMAPIAPGQVLLPPAQSPYKKWIIVALVVAGIGLASVGAWYVIKGRKRKKNPGSGPGRWTRFKQMVADE